ncbi:hypothetical protein LOK49_Contig125G00002 [Camellia lanceoleosa]|nr:hypothetical protein LOK49_Contig125G00002 [Camellia lanceoleosa]
MALYCQNEHILSSLEDTFSGPQMGVARLSTMFASLLPMRSGSIHNKDHYTFCSGHRLTFQPNMSNAFLLHFLFLFFKHHREGT